MHSISGAHIADDAIPGLSRLEDRVAKLEATISTFSNALDLLHHTDSGGKCLPDCISCRVRDTMQAIRVSENLMGEKMDSPRRVISDPRLTAISYAIKDLIEKNPHWDKADILEIIQKGMRVSP